MRFSSVPNISAQQVLQLPISKSTALVLLPLIFKEYLNPQARINKMTKTVSIPTLVLQKEPQGY